MVDGSMTKGRTIKSYHCHIWDVPDWIYSEESKFKAYKKWVLEPEAMLNQKALREGQSRFFGKWHEASGSTSPAHCRHRVSRALIPPMV